MSTQAVMSSTEYKACCTGLYENEALRFLLGDTWRPGGVEVTRVLASRARFAEPDLILDLACGLGESARLIRREYRSLVIGIDLTELNLHRAAARFGEWPRPGYPPAFVAGDAEGLPFADASFDAVLAECALSTFDDKAGAMAEAARTLQTGGRLCISDVTLDADALPPELNTLFGRVACLGGALPLNGYLVLVEHAGFEVEVTLDFQPAAMDFLRSIDRKLLLVRLAQNLKKLDFGGINVVATRNVLRTGMDLVAAGRLGYVGIVARKL
jgi:ubiquinone/menaquinone biosynthesis C-methylase UbiE